MKVLMGGLAILMITNVPYPAFPKIGIRSWRGVDGLAVVIGSICGIFIYGREFFFPAGMAYVLYGLVKTFVLGLVDRIPTGGEDDGDQGEYDDDRRSAEPGRDVGGGRHRRRARLRARLQTPPPSHPLPESDD
jgi:CDP-diacylglycerol---serine O-phosphatidyltransferase